jgi:hypothetical protein
VGVADSLEPQLIRTMAMALKTRVIKMAFFFIITPNNVGTYTTVPLVFQNEARKYRR